MARARRQPPLFEVLHEPSRRGSGGSALSPGTGLRPVQVTPSASAAAASAAASASRGREVKEEGPEPGPVEGVERERGIDPSWEKERTLKISQTTVLMGIAAVMVVLALTWIVAFKQGGKNVEAKLTGGATEEPVSPEIVDPMLGGRQERAGSGGGTVPRGDEPSRRTPTPTPAGPRQPESGSATVAQWTPGTDPRQPAHNYLVVATVPFRDAEVIAQFLTEHGVPAAAGPASDKVDPKRAMANNDAHVVFPLMAVPSDRYSAMKAERDALAAKVKQIGKLWKQAGGGSDFSDATWYRYK